jgi:hypothetical protein
LSSLFIKIGNTTYNAASVRWFRFDSESGQMCIGREGTETGELKLVDVRPNTLTSLLEQLAERKMLIEMTPSARPPGAQKNQA